MHRLALTGSRIEVSVSAALLSPDAGDRGSLTPGIGILITTDGESFTTSP